MNVDLESRQHNNCDDRKMNKIDVGFVEECESWRLESRFFPSKVGGKPAWLNLKDLPTYDDVQCNVCKLPCIFLCQIYAPYEEESRAFHRTLYIFICKNGACCKPNNNDNLRILRSQLARKNEFFPFEPPEEHEHWRPDLCAETWVETCRVCGILAPRRCAKCKTASYCCRDHQIRDWKAGHKQQCGSDTPKGKSITVESSSLNSALFPELEIVMEAEDKSALEKSEDDWAEQQEAEEMKRFELLVNSGKAGSFQAEKDVDVDLQNMSRAENDETFTSFSEKVKNNPDQILRYDRGGMPLYISSGGRPSSVPKCEVCNSERQFEFQIMPQLLNYLGFDDVLESFDWGTLLIYTCKESCVPKSGYIAEFIWKQDIVEEISETAVIK